MAAAVERLRAADARTVAAALAGFAGVVVYVLAHGVFPYYSMNHDEAVYLQQAAMLLDGRLFLYPPVEDAFHPWFFVDAGGRLYSKYSPVPAAVFALGKLAGGYRLALAGVAAANVGLTYAVVAETFDRRTGLLAGAFLLASPLFLIDSAVFLSYAPTTLFNLVFAFAYLRADRTGCADRAARTGRGGRTGSRRWAALAGAAVGVAFFARPYTAVLFAAPFVVHALWTLRDSGRDAGALPRRLDPDAVVRQGITAALGLAGVATALGYNAVVTGSPLVFPYQAFAPLDGPGFGYRAILAHDVVYTPELALRANARVLAALFGRWVVAGPLGTALAVVGLIAALSPVGRLVRDGGWRRWPFKWRDSQQGDSGDSHLEGSGDSRRSDSRETTAFARRAVLAGLFVTVVAGNVYFWGNYNVLGDLADPTDGLIRYLGPFYHFDLLVPTAAFAAHGSLVLAGRARRAIDARFDGTRARRVALAGLLAGAAVLGGAAVGAAAGPVADNRAVSAQLGAAYEPFEGRDLDGALVFLPTPYGDWTNHPFQALRNDPGFDGETVYALRENQFAVVDAYPDRALYRYTYRGAWVPFRGRPVDARLQPVRAVRGERVTATAALGVPDGAERVSVRLATEESNGSTYYVVNSSASPARSNRGASAARGTPDSLDLRVVVADGRARLAGPRVEPTGNATVPVGPRDAVVVQAFVDYGTSGFDYRLEMPVRRDGGEVRALTPYLEVCRDARRCDGEAAYVPSATREGVFVRARMTARR